jgi:Domain of unknown function (DUF4062)/Tetratricopeptide repeat
MAKVYVSSTIADLRQERQTVLDWLRAARHQAVDSYLPGSDTVRESCLDDIGLCDLYVLILGHRYGFVPADGNPGGLSITQLEFRRAGELGIPRIALLRTSMPDVRLSDVQDPARAALVWAFRAEVERAVRPAEFSDERGLIQGLSTGIQGELDKRDRLSGRVAARRTLGLAPRPAQLAGREDLLAELDARLTGSDGAGPRVMALCGLGGTGKTSVAVEYAHRHLDEVEVAWQFACEDSAVLAAGFGELAAQLGARDPMDSGDPVKSVHGMLADLPAEWLLVFDNALDRASVAPFVPPAGRGRVVITSRDPFWPPGQALDVPVLDQEVAARFLVSRTKDPDRRAALNLAGELGGLPLALERAAAYIEASGDSLAGYLASFRRRRIDMLGRGGPAGYSKTVATTWALAFEDLQHRASGAVGLLRLLAYCAPEAVPLHLLLQPRPELNDQFGPEVLPVLAPLLEDELAAKDAIVALRRYSLVIPAGNGLVSVHRLVQAVTADQMAADLAAQWHQAAAALIEAAIPHDAKLPSTWPDFAVLLPHAQAALAAESDGMQRIADYLGYSGNLVAARELSRAVLMTRLDILGEEHPRTLNTRASLARWIGRAGDPAGARDQFAALLPAYVRVFGSDHPHTVTTRQNLARWTGEAGDAVSARDQYAALLPDYERVFGTEHRGTLSTRGSLARWTGGAGDPPAARDQFAALLPAYEQAFGADHPETLTARYNIARWTGEAGDATGARDQFTALLPIYYRDLGIEHPYTLTTRHNLARWTGEAGDPVAARDQFTELLPLLERVLGPEHPDTLTARAELAQWTRQAEPTPDTP